MSEARLLHVVTRAYRRGAETFALSLHEALLREGSQSTLVALAPAPPGHQRLPARHLGPSPLHPRTLLALRRVAREADLVIAHGSTTLPACRLALAAAPSRFVYANIGDPLHWAASSTRRSRVRWMLKGAAAVAAITPTARDRLVEHIGVDRDKVVVTGNGRWAADFHPVAAEGRMALRRRLGLPEDAPVLVVVGALSPEKRVDRAIAVATAMPEVTLLVVGDGPEMPRLRSLVGPTDGDRVRFLGSVADVRPLYGAADAVVLTSETEGVPGVLIEAAMMGLPVVSTDVGFISDVVVHGRTGLLVAKDADTEALARAVRAAVRGRDQLGAKARTLACEQFDLSVVASRWLGLVHRVTAPRPDDA